MWTMASNLWTWLWDHKTTTVLVVVGLCLIPYWAYQAMLERKARERNQQAVEIAPDRAPGLRISFDNSAWRGLVQYQDGTQKPQDGLAILVLTHEDAVKSPYYPLLSDKPTDYPLVVFFNSTGFNAQVPPVMVRRAADGEVIHTGDVGKGFVRLALPQPNGKVRILTDLDDRPHEISQETWLYGYMGMVQPSLLEITVVHTAGGKETPAPDIEVLVLSGEHKANMPLIETAVDSIGKTDESGKLTVAVVPDSVYTVVVRQEGLLYGSLPNQDFWPVVRSDAAAARSMSFRIP